VCPVEVHSNCLDFYPDAGPDAGEEVPNDLPPEKGLRVRMTF
jgi:hypothetical protein